MKTFADRLKPDGQKKLLACDGGGIRGVISLEILKKIESILREKSGNSQLLLADYFDYFAGTSTGAIIATCLAIGMSVEEITKFYLESGSAMFSRARLLKRFWYKFEDDNLTRQLQTVFGADTRFGDPRIRTLLMVVLRNATTDSPWPLSNNPEAMFNATALDNCNLELPLWQIVRASTAAPTYFPPEIVTVGKQDFIFVDGGVTMYNNPAFQMFLMATLEPYRLQWKAGEDRMLIVSIGTGLSPSPDAHLQSSDMNLTYQASTVPSALMVAAQIEQDLLCRVFGKTVCGDEIDLEIGHLREAPNPGGAKMFTYARYNAELTEKGLKRLSLTGMRPEDVRQLDAVQFIPEMQQVGRRVAEVQVRPEHFDAFPPD